MIPVDGMVIATIRNTGASSTSDHQKEPATHTEPGDITRTKEEWAALEAGAKLALVLAQ